MLKLINIITYFHSTLIHLYARIVVSLERFIRPGSINTDPRFRNKPGLFYKTATGNYYLPTSTPLDCVVRNIRMNRIWEPEVVEVARQYIRRDSVVLDVGSNLGQMAILFSKMVGDNGQVLAFEADDYVFAILQKNIDANHCYNVRAFSRAVYDESNKMMFFPEQDFKRFKAYGSYGLDPNAKSGRNVKTIAIDDLNIQTPISFMKVDVQGSDLFAMRGAVQAIRQHRMPILFEFEEQFQEEFHTSFQDYLNFIDSIGYKIEKKILNINYLIIPDERKSFASLPGPTLMQDPKLSFPRPRLCKFLKTRSEVAECSQFLHQNGLFSHNLVCKDWDLAHIVPEIEGGNFLDMGSSDSYVLKNLNLKKIKGELYGIDLQQPDVPVKGVKYVIGDLMKTAFPDNFFANITCVSVIEHQVDFTQFAAEVSRLLQDQGKLFVTFDYWDPKIKIPIKIFDLNWQPLDRSLLIKFIEECAKKKLFLVDDMDWSIQDRVIDAHYYSPHRQVSYTFGMVAFEKR